MIPLIIALMRFLRYRQFGPSRPGVWWPSRRWPAGPPPGRGRRVARGRTTDRVLPAGRPRPGGGTISSRPSAPGRNLTWSLAAPARGVGWEVAAALLAFGGGWDPRRGLAVVTLLPALAAVSGPARWRTLPLPAPRRAGPRPGRPLSARAGARTHVVWSGSRLGGLSTSLSLPPGRPTEHVARGDQVHLPLHLWPRQDPRGPRRARRRRPRHRRHGGPEAFPEACYNVSNVHLKRGDPALAAAAGQRALANGCPPSAELLSPTAVGLAITGRWEEAEGMAGALHRDPRGMAILVQLAAAARRGDLAPLRAAQQSGRGDPALLQTRSRGCSTGRRGRGGPARAQPAPARPDRSGGRRRPGAPRRGRSGR